MFIAILVVSLQSIPINSKQYLYLICRWNPWSPKQPMESLVQLNLYAFVNGVSKIKKRQLSLLNCLGKFRSYLMLAEINRHYGPLVDPLKFIGKNNHKRRFPPWWKDIFRLFPRGEFRSQSGLIKTFQFCISKNIPA